jgi:hypothetical protein
VWLALTSIVLASAIVFNVLALWLTAWFERRQPESRSLYRAEHARRYPTIPRKIGLSNCPNSAEIVFADSFSSRS